ASCCATSWAWTFPAPIRPAKATSCLPCSRTMYIPWTSIWTSPSCTEHRSASRRPSPTGRWQATGCAIGLITPWLCRWGAPRAARSTDTGTCPAAWKSTRGSVLRCRSWREALAEFTGERVIPGQVDVDLLNEHVARYTFAARLSRGKRVLDAGCGEGYGSAELARAALSVV